MTFERERWFSLELPWRDNVRNYSCIPNGEYECHMSRSPRYGRMMYMIHDVPNRGGIRIHSGNYAGDELKGWLTHSRGCPLLGTKYGYMAGQAAVKSSRTAMRQFENSLDGRPFVLEIV